VRTRRAVITLVGGVAAWPLVARAQQRARPPRIGFLGLAFEPTAGEWLGAGLRDLGYIEGTNIWTSTAVARSRQMAQPM
jgi:hypothetical protein